MDRRNRKFLLISTLSLAVIVGSGWFVISDTDPVDEPGNLGLVRDPQIIADKIARKEGLRPDLQDGRRATIKGREEYWRMRRGEIEPGALMRARKQAEFLPITGADKDAGLPEWTWLGPGNIGGRVRAFVIDPSDPTRMWLGGVTGGIWRTTNSGNWWNPMNDFMANLAVSCMVMTPDQQFLFAGTGEGFPGGNVYPGEGVFRSGDLGLTWQQMNIPDPVDFMYINRLAPHPTVDGRMYAVTWNGVLYRTDDDGNSWTRVRILGALGYDVKITNQTSDGTPWIVIGADDDAFLSTDDGATFTSMVTGSTTPLPTNFGRAEMAFGTSSGNDPVLYASLQRNNGELWRSTDGGDTWTLRNTGNNHFLSSVNQGGYDNTLWVEPGNTNRVIVGGVDIWVSTDGGTTLTKKSNWRNYHFSTSAHADHHTIVPHPNYTTGSPVLYFGNDGGVQRSSNIWNNSQSSGWSNLANGLGITQFYHGAAATDGSVIMGGAQDNSFLRFNNGGSDSWFQAMTGDGAYVAVKPGAPSTIYASTQNLNLRRSRDGGNTYTVIGDSIPDKPLGNVLFIAPFKIDKSLSTALFAGGKSIWRSTNEGDNWYSFRDSIPGSPICSAIEQSESLSSRLYIGYNDGTVSRTLSSTPTWTDLDDNGVGLPNSFVTDIAVNPVNSSDVIVSFNKTGGDALWRSTNAGSSWSNIGGTGFLPLPDSPVHTVTFHPTNTSWIYVGTDVGVFATEDGGNNWSRTTSYPGSEGPANTMVSDLFWAGENLIAATYGRGMYRTWPRVSVFVDVANAGSPGQDGSDLNPYQSLNQAELSAGHGTSITVEGGTYQEVNGLELKKRGVLQTRNGTVIIK
ncbi:MAG: hypothetical protein ABFS42_13745 [Candidatus Krumholzibacteriota bacterium]